jgi:YidC/Oxa1 family membrane protein insertase
MELLINAFNLILYQPLFNALILLYQYLPGRDFGIAVIVLTLLIRLILYPSMAQSLRSQKALSLLQPKIQEIQKKYKQDLAKQSRAMIELYKKEKISPLSGIFPLLIQLPILIALYRLFWKGFEEKQMIFLYSFIPTPGGIDPMFLNLLDLARPSIVLAVLAGALQYFQGRGMVASQSALKNPSGKRGVGFSEMLQKQMLYFFPVLTVFILWNLPSAIGLYWIATTAFSIAQQYLIFKPAGETPIRSVTAG